MFQLSFRFPDFLICRLPIEFFTIILLLQLDIDHVFINTFYMCTPPRSNSSILFSYKDHAPNRMGSSDSDIGREEHEDPPLSEGYQIRPKHGGIVPMKSLPGKVRKWRLTVLTARMLTI